MQRTLVNFWLDVFLLVVFLVDLWTSFVLRFLFPPGTAALGWELWGWGYDHWANVQFISQCVLGIGILVHVMLHWKWVCGVLTARILPHGRGEHHTWDDGIRTIVGVGFMIVLLNILGIAFAAAALTIQGPS
ncbi:MAG: DUF4405 domain-containing protein [Planctomycetales bacterium]|nr:DUF4405 domain-containing protein [Planctomycetales bacterium]